MPDLDEVLDRACEVPVVAIAGPVAVGKSTLASALADGLAHRGRTAQVVATDGFLWPNAVLEDRGLLARKGEPDTYDLDRLQAVVDAARAGVDALEVPVYSHRRYDVLEEPERLDRPDVLLVEGVVALQRRFGELNVYLDAATDHVEAWYVARFHDLVAEARDDPDSFYRGWIDLAPDEVGDLARAVWNGVNLPNLVTHIAPTRARADVVVHKDADHAIREVTWTVP